MRGLISDYEETTAREASRGEGGAEKEEQAVAFGGAAAAAASSGAVLTVDASVIDKQGGAGAPSVEGALISTLFSAGLNEDMPLPEEAMAVLTKAGGIDAGESAVEACAKYMREKKLLPDYVSIHAH